MNVVYIPRRFAPGDWGGTETVVLETSRRLRDLGHRVEVLCPDALSGISREDVGGIPVRRFPYFYPYLGLDEQSRRQLDRKGGNLFSFSLLRALHNYPDLDLIHLHTGKRLGGIGRRVALHRHIPYVITLHGGVHDVPAEEVRTWTEPTRGTLEWGKVLGLWVGSRRVLQDAAAIVCIGLEEQNLTQARFPDKRVVYIPNGVDADRFAAGEGDRFRHLHGIPRGARVILTVGRIDPQKDQRLAVRFIAEAAREDPSVHLLLVGFVTNEAYRESLVNDVKEAGLESRVTIIPGLGAENGELADAYHAADVFLLPSVHEPFGMVILEAWSAGLPVLASRTGGTSSFVEDGKDGLLFEPGNVSGCLRAWQTLSRLEDSGKSLGEAGRAKAAARYSWDEVTRRLQSLYEEVLRDQPGSS